MTDEFPAVTCLCPTYGRFARLREALACFLAQDYPNKRLLILNDGPNYISLVKPWHKFDLPTQWDLCEGEEDDEIVILNSEGMFTNLGQKRTALVSLAEGEIAAHWDDDDLYLPWHLSRGVQALLRTGAGCVKSRGAWYMKGLARAISASLALQVHGVHHNVFEGSMVFRREEALALGGYPSKHSGQAKALMAAFEKAGRLYKILDSEGTPSYVYRWANGVGHISSIGDHADSLERFRRRNQDFGDGQPLTPADLVPYWQALIRAGCEKLRQQ